MYNIYRIMYNIYRNNKKEIALIRTSCFTFFLKEMLQSHLPPCIQRHGACNATEKVLKYKSIMINDIKC